MPPAFDRTTAVVDFGASSRPLRWGARRWILWPAYAYKVLLPMRGQPPFNVFQRAMLDLCRAGVRHDDDIARRLALPQDLVNFVLAQLHATDALDDARAPTTRALRLLAEEDEPTTIEDAGYVFIDAHSLRVWPRVHPGALPIVDADHEAGGLARFVRGTPGNPEEVRARVLWPSVAQPPQPPTAYQVLKAARQHTRRVRAYQRESERAADRDDVFDGLSAKRVRVVGTAPEPIFVAACVFLPRDAQQRAWLVTDPCGLGVTDLLRAGLRALAEEGVYRVDALLTDVAGEAWRVDGGDLALYLREAAHTATDRLARRLGDATAVFPPRLLDRLADADARLDGARTAKPIEDFLANAYAALEGVFDWLVERYPNVNASALGDNPHRNAAFLRRIAEGLGFEVPADMPLLRGVTGRAVDRAIDRGGQALRESLAAALLAAHARSDHPLAVLATRVPDALALLVELFHLRREASHDTDAVPSVETAIAIRERVFAFLRALVGFGAIDAVPSHVEHAWGASLLFRLRAQAEQAAAGCPGLDERPALRARVIEMHNAALIVKLLAAEAQPRALSTRIRDAVVAIAIAVEAVFAEVGDEAASDGRFAGAVSDDRRENAARLTAAARALGFALDASGELPRSLSYARVDRIRRATSGEGETLSARVAALLLAAHGQSAHPMWNIARRAPRLLVRVGWLVDVRRHGDEVDATAAEVDELEIAMAEEIRAVLEAIDEGGR